MEIYNITIETNDHGNKIIPIHADTSIDMKMVISKLISKYTNIGSFFDISVENDNYLYKTNEITVVITNDFVANINFHAHSAIKAISIKKTPILH